MNTLPEENFVESEPRRGSVAQHAAADQPRASAFARAAARDPDVDHVDVARVGLAGRDPQPGLGAVEGRGRRSPGPPRPSTSPVEAFTPLGTSAATTRAFAALIAAITPSTGLRGAPSKPVPSTRVDDHVGALERRRRRTAPARAAGQPLEHLRRVALQPLARPDEQHVDVPARLAQQPRGDEPVAAVVALAADDRDAAGRRVLAPRPRGEPLPRALHQVQRRDRRGSRSPTRPSRASARRRAAAPASAAGSSAQHRDRAGHPARVGQRDLDGRAELARARGGGAGQPHLRRRVAAADAPRCRASSTRAG